MAAERNSALRTSIRDFQKYFNTCTDPTLLNDSMCMSCVNCLPVAHIDRAYNIEEYLYYLVMILSYTTDKHDTN